jgi:hypothetical protein
MVSWLGLLFMAFFIAALSFAMVSVLTQWRARRAWRASQVGEADLLDEVAALRDEVERLRRDFEQLRKRIDSEPSEAVRELP